MWNIINQFINKVLFSDSTNFSEGIISNTLDFQDPGSIYALGYIHLHNLLCWYIIVMVILIFVLIIYFTHDYKWTATRANTMNFWDFSKYLKIIRPVKIYNISTIKHSPLFLIYYIISYVINFFLRTQNYLLSFFGSSYENLLLNKSNKHLDLDLKNYKFLISSWLKGYFRTQAFGHLFYASFSKKFNFIPDSLSAIKFIENFPTESFFALFPTAIIANILGPSIDLIHTPTEEEENGIRIKIEGRQWYWTYSSESVVNRIECHNTIYPEIAFNDFTEVMNSNLELIIMGKFFIEELSISYNNNSYDDFIKNFWERYEEDLKSVASFLTISKVESREEICNILFHTQTIDEKIFNRAALCKIFSISFLEDPKINDSNIIGKWDQSNIWNIKYASKLNTKLLALWDETFPSPCLYMLSDEGDKVPFLKVRNITKLLIESNIITQSDIDNFNINDIIFRNTKMRWWPSIVRRVLGIKPYLFNRFDRIIYSQDCFRAFKTKKDIINCLIYWNSLDYNVFISHAFIFQKFRSLGISASCKYDFNNVNLTSEGKLIDYRTNELYPKALIATMNYTFDSNIVGDKDLNKGEKRLLDVDLPLFVPSSSILNLVVTSGDVVHSYSTPELGLKIDAIPGRLSSQSLMVLHPGRYYGQCSELCGPGHAFMPIVIDAY